MCTYHSHTSDIDVFLLERYVLITSSWQCIVATHDAIWLLVRCIGTTHDRLGNEKVEWNGTDWTPKNFCLTLTYTLSLFSPHPLLFPSLSLSPYQNHQLSTPLIPNYQSNFHLSPQHQPHTNIATIKLHIFFCIFYTHTSNIDTFSCRLIPMHYTI